MDAANSGSIHSSSGGDHEEFDSSRGDQSLPPFLNPFLTHQNPTFFDPQQVHINLDHAFPQSNANDNNDLVWSRRSLLGSQHNYANFGNLTSSSSLPSRTQSLNAGPQQGPLSSLPLRAEPESQAPKASLGLNHTSVAIKNPKKRTRASRRAPTTVLKTDTANFRQMVQEFTGIPAGPFSDRRPDLFSSAAALRPGTRFVDPLGPLYPLRPLTQKGLSPFSSSTPPPPSLLNSTMVDSTVPTTNIVSTNTTAPASVAAAGLGSSTSNNSNNYALLSNQNLQHHGIPLQLGGTAAMNFGSFQSEEITTSAATVQIRRSDNLTR